MTSESFGLRKRPGWDEYFLGLVKEISSRSCDASRQHGCIFVRDNIPVMTGYNGLPHGGDDTLYPSCRPDKYYFYAHSEENAVALAARRGVATDGSTAYVTGPPCVKCIRLMWQAGIVRIVYPANTDGWSLDGEESAARALLTRNTGIVIDEINYPGESCQ